MAQKVTAENEQAKGLTKTGAHGVDERESVCFDCVCVERGVALYAYRVFLRSSKQQQQQRAKEAVVTFILQSQVESLPPCTANHCGANHNQSLNNPPNKSRKSTALYGKSLRCDLE